MKPRAALPSAAPLADGRKVAVGTLAQNRDGVYFAYEAAYLQQHGNLSPYQLRAVDTAGRVDRFKRKYGKK